MNSDKLQKIIANHGKASRRKAEQWIAEGRVSVNGHIVEVGTRVKADDVIRIDGHILPKIKSAQKVQVVLYYKQEGEICSRIEENNLQTVYSKLPAISHGRWISVGRLDVNTSGLMLFTNNGVLANHLMHPRRQFERVYAVRVLGEVPLKVVKRLMTGVRLDDGLAKFKNIRDAGGRGANHWYEVVMTEGRKREVRRLWESQGYKVSRLVRTRFGPIKLPRNLKRGRYLQLSGDNVQKFLSVCQFKTE